MNEVITKIREHISYLEEVVGTMMFNGADGSSLVDILNKVLDIGNVSLLYSSELSMEELDMVSSTFALSESLLKPLSEKDIDSTMQIVAERVDKIESLYRDKNLLLGHENDQKIKCA